MNNETFTNKLKEFVATVAWKVFLWARNITEEEYWNEITKQEIDYSIDFWYNYIESVYNERDSYYK